jgi:D-glycerate 3-kinase
MPYSYFPLMALLDNQREPELWPILLANVLADPSRAEAFGITTETVQSHLKLRVELFRKVYPEFQTFCESRHLSTATALPLLWDLWLPLAMRSAERRQKQSSPFIQGILGGQGTGKTTLGAALTLILKHLGYRTLSLSLDDLYKTHTDRLQLQQIDPRLIWRGPPGTHDVELGVRTLDQLRQPSSESIIWVPRFDKSLHQGSGDRISPEPTPPVDIVLFEGWFVGVHPIDPALFEQAPEPIETEGDRAFARDMNAQLQTYLPLWERLDSLIVLSPTDYRFSLMWRQQAEREMWAAGKPGMDEAEVKAFVHYFWKALHPQLFITPLLTDPTLADLGIEINAEHEPERIYPIRSQLQ